MVRRRRKSGSGLLERHSMVREKIVSGAAAAGTPWVLVLLQHSLEYVFSVLLQNSLEYIFFCILQHYLEYIVSSNLRNVNRFGSKEF